VVRVGAVEQDKTAMQPQESHTVYTPPAGDGGIAGVARDEVDTMLPAQPLLEGDPSRLGRYRLLGRLGRGGMGVVYLGRDQDGRLVAIKVMRPELAASPDYLGRFRHEVELGRKVRGAFVAEVLDAGVDSDQPYLVTAYIEGQTLQARVRERGPLPPPEVGRLAVGVAGALSAIHAAGLVHRDLKPGNVLLSAAGPRVIDFGVARLVGDRSGRIAGDARPGTPEFMAPEQFDGVQVGPAADVFAWGGLLIYGSTGRPPFGDKGAAGGVEALERRVRYQQPDLGPLDGPLLELVAAAMAKLPSGRPTAKALVQHLAPAGSCPAGGAGLNGWRGATGRLLAGRWSLTRLARRQPRQ
jgi:eukaryotic-like serine/threonine-protein kinase